MESVIVVGAGPVGCATALALAQRGYKVEIQEAKADPREQQQTSDRSINLAISARGLATLRKISPEMAERVASHFVPMGGRMVHDLEGNQSGVAYGLFGESIQSVSRATLNELLLTEAANAGIPITFERPFERLGGQLTIGCDGTYSKVRQAMTRLGEFNTSQEYIEHWYLEIPIPAINGEFAYHPNYLHIWPRQQYMFIALANQDKTMTGTMFAPKSLFAELDTFDKFAQFFKAQFPDAHAVVEDLAAAYSNPRGKLVSNKVFPYHYEDRVVVLGDAAHSMVPFYGQGLNCGLEDVSVLMDALDASGSRQQAFELYSQQRKPDLDAIQQLSMDNYHEMRSAVTKRSFFLRKWIDGLLGRNLGDKWLPLYTMVSFRSDISYSQAVRESARQTRLLESVGWLATAAVAGAIGYRWWK